MATKRLLLRLTLGLLGAGVLGCTPVGPGTGDQNGNTGSGAKLSDLGVELQDVPVGEYAALLSEGVSLGINGIGAVPAESLAGDWTGTLVNNEFGTVFQVDLAFNDEGRLTDYFQRGGGLPAIDWNFVTQEIAEFSLTQNGKLTVRPVASTVRANADGSVDVSTVNVVDFDQTTGRTRVEETLSLHLTLDQTKGVLSGDGTLVDIVINSAVPGTETGRETTRLTYQGNFQPIDVAPGRARRLLRDLDRPITEFDDSIYQAALPPDYALGTNVSGDGSRAALPGIWAGAITDPGGLLSGTVNLEFDGDGRLLRYDHNPAGTPLFDEIDLKDRKPLKSGDIQTLVPLASRVSTDDGRSFNFQIIYLQHLSTDDGQTSRYIVTLSLIATISDVDGGMLLTGSLQNEVLASTNPTTVRGITVTLSNPTGTLDPMVPVWRDATASAAAENLETGLADLSAETLAALLPTDLPLGMSRSGPGDAASLAGDWRGTETLVTNSGSVATELRFGQDGGLILLGGFDFQTRGIVTQDSDGATTSVVPLASRVEVDESGRVRIIAVTLVQFTNATGGIRYIETTVYRLQSSDSGGTLFGRDVTAQAWRNNLTLSDAPFYTPDRYNASFTRQ